MINIFNELIEKKSLNKILKLSLPKLKRALTYRNISIHHLKWYFIRGLNSETQKDQFKKLLQDFIKK